LARILYEMLSQDCAESSNPDNSKKSVGTRDVLPGLCGVVQPGQQQEKCWHITARIYGRNKCCSFQAR
jgi:hypothetical protein